MIAGGQTATYSYLGNGQTWILQADQHPLHPGNSHPNAHVEACGNLSNWTPDLVNNFPQDDADPIVDIYCGLVSGSYDPNDKNGYPTGISNDHYVLPNQQLQYIIRFQNTGTDTAFTVVIRDTLDTDINIFTVVPGTASHPYIFKMYGPRVLEWTFQNILLPDSTTNQAGSHGFASFQADLAPNLSSGTQITNVADIYFDFNEPVITNQTLHTINDQLQVINTTEVNELIVDGQMIRIFPNPTTNQINIQIPIEFMGSAYSIVNSMGKTIMTGKFNSENSTINLNNLSSGIYMIKIGKDSRHTFKIIKN
jgi:uncharacterized repeat protein (TIGR01451 family)